jgi:hypothetical protein
MVITPTEKQYKDENPGTNIIKLILSCVYFLSVVVAKDWQNYRPNLFFVTSVATGLMHVLELIKESVRGGEVWRTSLSKQKEYIGRVPQVFAVVLFGSLSSTLSRQLGQASSNRDTEGRRSKRDQQL